ncbi:hypothetical protein O181_009644 [Austropuccinia psidii MF-1]|uniref:Uncharacterized protein n=1 Tax=Austropuccinia psidii MF-1 TaxID=1389203 RepID=A0A9Q3GK24_9BASI|nr:hypothetical protein [Austropuccinia psidii MF-1]
MTIIYKERKSHTNADGISRWPLHNFRRNAPYDPEVSAILPIHFMEMYRKKNFRFSEWAPGSCTPNTKKSRPEETETPILGISSSEIHNNFFNSGYTSTRNTTGLKHQPVLYHREVTLTDRKRVELLITCKSLEKILTIHPTAKYLHDIWENACDTAAGCIAEAKEYNKQKYGKTHKEPDFIEGDKVLVSNVNSNNLKFLKKMRNSFLGTFSIIRLIGKNSVEFRLIEGFFRKHPMLPVSLFKPYHKAGEDILPSRNKGFTQQDIVEVEGSPGHMKRS